MVKKNKVYIVGFWVSLIVLQLVLVLLAVAWLFGPTAPPEEIGTLEIATLAPASAPASAPGAPLALDVPEDMRCRL